MMNDTFNFVLSLSIVFAAVIGIIRWRVIDSAYYPFIYNVLVVFAVELINGLHSYSSASIKLINLFSITDFCLFAWLFHNWGLFNYNRKWFLSVLGIFIGIWVVITFFITGFSNINRPFLLVYSFALIFFSVTTFNKIVVQQRINIFTNARFWICMGILIFYTFFILTQATGLSSGLYFSRSFKQNIQAITIYTNVLVNLLYAVAAIWVPRKKNIMTLL